MYYPLSLDIGIDNNVEKTGPCFAKCYKQGFKHRAVGQFEVVRLHCLKGELLCGLFLRSIQASSFHGSKQKAGSHAFVAR